MSISEKSSIVFKIDDLNIFKKKAFAWVANAFDICCCLDNNAYTEGLIHPEFECLVACGAQSILSLRDDKNAFEKLKEYYISKQDWLFGFLSYDLKNSIEKLTSDNLDSVQMPDLHFFQPIIIFKITTSQIEILKNEHLGYSNEAVFKKINDLELEKEFQVTSEFELKKRFSKEEYIKTVEAIKHNIQQGDIFEMNFCQEFYGENVHLKPIDLFFKLNEISKAPFSAFYKLKNKYAICASPERFLKKVGDKLISQPIKGTSKRGDSVRRTPNGESEDEQLKNALKNDPKNRSENVMIVDLVRNDLGKSCVAGTVKVSELFGIYTFPTVHQMISTVEGQLRPDVHFMDAIKNAFPMGSMTGAPKVRAMQLIEDYEKTQRGLYSGAIGYITPEGNFDFNVMIRSILYNKINRYLSFQVGGAIVADSDAEKEFDECLVKAKGVMRALGKE